MFFSSASTSAFSFSVLCWLKATLSSYMGDVRHNECGLMFGNLCSLTTGFDCLFNSKYPRVKSWYLTHSLGVFSFHLGEAKACAEPRFVENRFCNFSVFIESSANWWREKNMVINAMKGMFTTTAILFIPYALLILLCGLDYFNAIFSCYCQR